MASLNEIVERMKKPDVGCIVIYVGIVRGDEGVRWMNVSVSSDISDAIKSLCDEAKEKFEISDARMEIKTGLLRVGDTITEIFVSAAHREDAFKACKYIIDKLKAGAVPMKKEVIREFQDEER